MRLIKVPRDCTRDTFLLCVKVALTTLCRCGRALVILDDDSIEYDTQKKEGLYSYSLFSDKCSIEAITCGWQGKVIAVEELDHITKEGIDRIKAILSVEKDGIIIAKERRTRA